MESYDRYLESYRREPRPAFARALRERLREGEEARRSPALRPLLAGGVALAVVVALFAFPSVRIWAQSVLDLFRVRSFVAVSFDPERLEKLRALKQDAAFLVFDRQEVIQDPGPPATVATPEAASVSAGIPVETPRFLPEGLRLDAVTVRGEGRGRLGASSERLRTVLASLDLSDVQVPAGLDGQVIEVHLYPVVGLRYGGTRAQVELTQARSPEVSLPVGVDLVRLGEIGLRILGLDAGEARRIASSVDWRSTLLVPVPANASSFRRVSVQGQPGLLITTSLPPDAEGRRRRDGTVILWTEGERVFALTGNLGNPDLMQIAESIR